MLINIPGCRKFTKPAIGLPTYRRQLPPPVFGRGVVFFFFARQLTFRKRAELIRPRSSAGPRFWVTGQPARMSWLTSRERRSAPFPVLSVYIRPTPRTAWHTSAEKTLSRPDYLRQKKKRKKKKGLWVDINSIHLYFEGWFPTGRLQIHPLSRASVTALVSRSYPFTAAVGIFSFGRLNVILRGRFDRHRRHDAAGRVWYT